MQFQVTCAGEYRCTCAFMHANIGGVTWLCALLPVSYCDSRRGAGNMEGDTQATENQTQKLFVEPRVQGQLLGRDQLIAWPSEQE